MPQRCEEKARSLSRLAALGAAVAVLTCFFIAAGWYFDISWLRTPFQDGGTVSLGACLLLGLLCLAVLVRCVASTTRFVTLACSIAAVMVAVAGSLKAIETILSADWITSFQITGPGEDRNPLTIPGAVSPDVCVLVAIYGLALALTSTKWKLKEKWFIYQLLAALGFVISLIPIMGFISGQESMCTVYGCIRQPVLVSLISLLTAFAILFRDIADSPLADAAQPNRAGRNWRTVLLLTLVACPAAVILKGLVVTIGFADKGLASSIALASLGGVAAKLLFASPSAGGVEAPAPDPSVTASENDGVLSDSTDSVSEALAGARPSTPVSLAACFRCPSCEKEYDESLEFCPVDGAELSIAFVDRLIGSVFARKFRIDSFLGRGGMSTVYLAHHLLMVKPVAIKLMHSNIRMNEAAIRRFHIEAKAMSRLTHPNVLQAIDFGFFDGMPYLIMDLVKGHSLSEKLKSEGQLSLSAFFEISRQVCLGLSHAHLNGIVHRDLKPANIMLLQQDGQDGVQVKIVDFGLAKMAEPESSSGGKLTQTGDCMGSPLYMSPEQCTGSPIDQRSDIYSLGCVFYEALTGRCPLEADSILEVMRAHISESPKEFPADSRIPITLQQLIMRMLCKEPADRPQSADHVLTDLKEAQARWLEGLDAHASESSLPSAVQ